VQPLYSFANNCSCSVTSTDPLGQDRLRDFAPGARSLNLSCPSGAVLVTEQEQLLAKLYSGCTLPVNWANVLTSS
jgi:hypothetical protein